MIGYHHHDAMPWLKIFRHFMKLLDSYILKALAVSYLLCITLVISFYIVLDLFTNFEKFDEYRTMMTKDQPGAKELHLGWLILKYYAYNAPLIIYDLTPIATLLAGMFTLTRMSKANELIPLKASGISMYRLMIPFLEFAVCVGLGMVVLHEQCIANLEDELEKLQHMRYTRYSEVATIQYCDTDHRIFMVNRYLVTTRELQKVRVLVPQAGERIQPKTVIQAEIGYWTKHQGQHAVLLQNGTITHYAANGEVQGQPMAIPEQGYVVVTDFCDTSITQPVKKNWNLLSLARLVEVLEKNPDLSAASLTLHLRFSLPLSNALLLLLGLPWLLRKETRNFFLGAGICALISGAFYGLYLACMNLGYKEILNPIFAAWFPTVFFGSWAASFWTWIHT